MRWRRRRRSFSEGDNSIEGGLTTTRGDENRQAAKWTQKRSRGGDRDDWRRQEGDSDKERKKLKSQTLRWLQEAR